MNTFDFEEIIEMMDLTPIEVLEILEEQGYNIHSLPVGVEDYE